MKIKHFLILYFVILFCFSGKSQNSGFLGRKMLLKTQPIQFITGNMAHQAEYAIYRHVSITANYASKTFVEEGYGDFGYSELKVKDIVTGFRFYFTPEQASPSGGYHFVCFGFGRGKANGERNIDYDENGQYLYGVKEQFQINKIRTMRGQVGFGYQQIYLNLISLDLSFSYDLALIRSISKTEKYLSIFSDTYGTQRSFYDIGTNVMSGGFSVIFRIGVLVF